MRTGCITPWGSPFRRRLVAAGFTLIELLVVISIIAVLAGLLLAVINKVTESARKASAKAMETQIVAAVNNYQAEYGVYPLEAPGGGATTTDVTFDDTNLSNVNLFRVLRAMNADDPNMASLNSRRITYFEARNVKNPKVPKDGFVLTNGVFSANGKTNLTAGDLVDPWGNVYWIRVDGGFSGKVVNPYSGSVTNDTTDAGAKDTSLLRVGVIAYSFGADGRIADKGVMPSSPYTAVGDDVDSWQ